METQFSCRTAAKYYSYSEAFFRKHLKLRNIKSFKIGHSRRMYKSDIEKFFRGLGIAEVK